MDLTQSWGVGRRKVSDGTTFRSFSTQRSRSKSESSRVKIFRAGIAIAKCQVFGAEALDLLKDKQCAMSALIYENIFLAALLAVHSTPEYSGGGQQEKARDLAENLHQISTAFS